jgi:hypothetical protein
MENAPTIVILRQNPTHKIKRIDLLEKMSQDNTIPGLIKRIIAIVDNNKFMSNSR